MVPLSPPHVVGAVRQEFERLLPRLLSCCQATYGERLVTLAVFGSVGRGVPRPSSDIDLLLIAEPLPSGRIPRVDEFGAVETALAPDLRSAANAGVATRLSPMFKTPGEVRQGSPLFLDMTDDARILHDRGSFFTEQLALLRTRLAKLHARRIWIGNAWIWDLKPDYRPGEVIDL